MQTTSPGRPARGWYARLATGKVVFLGDSSGTAHIRIVRLLEAAAEEP